MEDAKGIKHSSECEKSQFLKELKKLKQRASQLRCQIGELVLVSERMEKEEKRSDQLQVRLEYCDSRVTELEEELWKKTQEVELARDTYRMLRKDLEEFNKNLTSDESCSASPRKKSLLRSGGRRKKRKEKEEEEEEEEEEEDEEEEGKDSLFQRASDCSPSPVPSSSSVTTKPSQETDKRTDPETDERTDPETDKRTDPETDPRTVNLSANYDDFSSHNRETNKALDCDGGRKETETKEDALSQQQLKNYDGDDIVKTKRRKKTVRKQEEGAEKKEEGDQKERNLQTESTEAQRGREEGGEGGGRDGGRAGGKDCNEEEMEGERKRKSKRNRPVKNSASYVVSTDCNSRFKSSVEMTQPTSTVTSPNKKTRCLTSIRISEVHPRGKYIRIINSSQTKEEDLGNHFLLQRYQDTPFTVFRFPSAVHLRPLGVATVWSASGAAEESAAGRQIPSTDFVFSSQPIWASGPDCITILCKPNEQALNWLSSSPCLSNRPNPSSLGASSPRKHQPETTNCKSYVVHPRHKDDLQSACKDDPGKKEWQTRSNEEDCRRSDSKARAEKRQTDCKKTPDSSPGRRTVQRKKVASADENQERRQRTREQSESRKRKRKEVRVEQRTRKEEEEECIGCEEEIRRNSRRRRRLEKCEEEDRQRRRRRRTGRGSSPGSDDCWKRVAIMDKKIPCTFVHIEEQSTSPATATGHKAAEGGGGGCVEEHSDCGEDRDCVETNRRNSFGANYNSLRCSKNCNGAMNDSNHDDNDCGSCSESPKQKRQGHASLGRCIEPKEAAVKGSSRMTDCKKKKEARNALAGGQRRTCEDTEELGHVKKKAGGSCGSEEDEAVCDCEDGCGRKKTSPGRRRKCDDYVDGRKKVDGVKEKKKGGCGGGTGCGGGGGGGGGRRRMEECRTYEDCCGSGTDGDGSWAKWRKWLAGLVSWQRKKGFCRDQPCFSSSTLDCLEQKSMADTEVTCLDEVHVRDVCPPYRPRFANGTHCSCSDGCPACPPKRPDCYEQVGIAERSRQRTVKKNMAESGGKKCDCAGPQQKKEAAKRGGRCSGTRSEGCLTGASATDVCDCWCHLDSVALTAASVMAAGLTVAAIYCN